MYLAILIYFPYKISQWYPRIQGHRKSPTSLPISLNDCSGNRIKCINVCLFYFQRSSDAEEEVGDDPPLVLFGKMVISGEGEPQSLDSCKQSYV